MKTLFLGGLAARVAPRILGKMTEKLDTNIMAELTDMQRLIPALAEAEIVVGHIWRSDFPEAPRLKLLQAATAGVDMIDIPSRASQHHVVQRLRPRARHRRVCADDDAGFEQSTPRNGDSIPRRVMGGASARRRSAAWRGTR
jgi:hypothetical protein